MKTSMIILFVLVAISLVFSLFALFILAENHISINNGNPTPSTRTPTSKPTPTQVNTNLDIGYVEADREDNGNNTRVTLTVTATFESGSEMQVNYSQFYLQLYALRFTAHIDNGQIDPSNSGSFTIGPNQQVITFQLVFEYYNVGWNGIENSALVYNLDYNGVAQINWTTPRN